MPTEFRSTLVSACAATIEGESKLSFIVRVLLAVAGFGLAVPALAAPFDGDWEGDLRCEPSGSLVAIYEPVLASVRGTQIKLLRGNEQDNDVVEGSVGSDGAARISGRARLADGAISYVNVAGRFVPARFTGQGTAVPEAGGAVRQCTLSLQVETAARGEGAPPDASAPDQDDQAPYAPVIVYGSDSVGGGGFYPTWNDNNFYWRRAMMRRWEYRLWQREQAIRIYCEQNPRACGHAAVFPHPPSSRPPHPRPPQRDPQPPTSSVGGQGPKGNQQIVTPAQPRQTTTENGVTVVRPDRPQPQVIPTPNGGAAFKVPGTSGTGSPYQTQGTGSAGSPYQTPGSPSRAGGLNGEPYKAPTTNVPPATVTPSGAVASPYRAPSTSTTPLLVTPPPKIDPPPSVPTANPPARRDPQPQQSDQRAKCAPGVKC